jgi:uridylate kinase
MEVLSRRLEVMDATALTMCMDNNLEVIVFDVQGHRSIERALKGEKIGTRVTSSSEMTVLN